MQKRLLLVALGLTTCTCLALADDDDSDDYIALKKQGYEEWKVTTVKEPFQGCATGQTIPFANGMAFKCSEAEDHDKDDGNKVTILRNKAQGLYKVFIGDDDYEGQLLNLR